MIRDLHAAAGTADLPASRDPAAAADKAPLVFRRFTGAAGLERLREEWTRLARSLRPCRFIHLPEWYAAYLDALEPDERSVEFHAAYRAGELRAVFPLKAVTWRVTGFPIRTLTVPQHPHLPFSDFVMSPEESGGTLLGALVAHLNGLLDESWDVLHLRNVLEDSAIARALAEPGAPRALTREVGRCDRIPCDAPFDVLRRGFSRNLKGDLRKARNRLLREPDVAFEWARDRAALDAAFEEFLRVEASGWKGRAGEGSAIALHPELVRFYRGLAERFSDGAGCEIGLLRAGGECIAAQFSLVVDGVYYLLKIGYAEDRAALAPGNLLLQALLERLCAMPGIVALDLVSDAAWHARWRPQSLAIRHHGIANATPRGAAALALLRARRAVAPHVRRLRGLLTRATASARATAVSRPHPALSDERNSEGDTDTLPAAEN